MLNRPEPPRRLRGGDDVDWVGVGCFHGLGAVLVLGRWPSHVDWKPVEGPITGQFWEAPLR